MKIDSPNSLGISTGFGIPTGGTDNQVLSKVNSTNYNTQWINTSGLTNIIYGVEMFPTYTEITNTTADVVSFTLPSSGTWKITYTARLNPSLSTTIGTIFITNNANTEVPNSRGLAIFGVAGGQSTVTNFVFVTITSPTTYKIRCVSFNGTTGVQNDTSGVSKVIWERIGQ